MTCEELKQKLNHTNASCSCFTNSHVAQENGMKLIIKPKTKKGDLSFCKVEVDDCLIKSNNNKKCDYCFVVNNTNVVFVELKGCRAKDAFEQILQTYLYFKPKLSNKEYKYQGEIVGSKVPRISPEIKKEKIRLRKKGIIVNVHTRQATLKF